MSRKAKLLVAPLVIALAQATAAGPAAAQDQSVDPDAGSPSGTIYEIPLDDGRGDAAPRGSGGGGTAGTAGGGGQGGSSSTSAPSPIRSQDNGFGSTSQVPGAPAKKGQGGASGKKGGGADEGDIAAGQAQPQTQTAAASAGMPSVTRSILLLALAAVVAAGLGLAARGARRGRSG